MFGLGGQPSDGVVDGSRLKRGEIRARLTGQPFGERRSRGDRGGAAARFVARLGDTITGESDREAEDIAANRIRHFDRQRGRRQPADVAGILEVIEDARGIHVCSNNHDMTTVVAAIVRRGTRVLICRRKADQAHPLKWEFPGGKVEAGESVADALRRELEEELAVDAAVGCEVDRYEFSYPGKKPILLIFLAAEFAGEATNRIFEEIRWAEVRDLPRFDFLEGDVDFVRRLAKLA